MMIISSLVSLISIMMMIISSLVSLITVMMIISAPRRCRGRPRASAGRAAGATAGDRVSTGACSGWWSRPGDDHYHYHYDHHYLNGNHYQNGAGWVWPCWGGHARYLHGQRSRWEENINILFNVKAFVGWINLNKLQQTLAYSHNWCIKV